MRFDPLVLTKLVKYYLNGVLFGLVSWALQFFFYKTMISLFPDSALILSIYLSFFVVLVLNYFSQRLLVFRSPGKKLNFGVVSFLAIIAVSIVSEMLHHLFENFNFGAVDYFYYPMAALFVSPFIFLIKLKFVFK